MREKGVLFRGFQDGVMISERREESDCAGSAGDQVMFAVKTCEKFHQTRISVIKNTWGKYAKYVNVYSDKEDDTIPTIKLSNWVEPRIKKFFGCNKTLSILNHFLEDSMNHKWLVLVDDDTILSVSRVRSIINCYSNELDPVMIGE